MASPVNPLCPASVAVSVWHEDQQSYHFSHPRRCLRTGCRPYPSQPTGGKKTIGLIQGGRKGGCEAQSGIDGQTKINKTKKQVKQKNENNNKMKQGYKQWMVSNGLAGMGDGRISKWRTHSGHHPRPLRDTERSDWRVGTRTLSGSSPRCS